MTRLLTAVVLTLLMPAAQRPPVAGLSHVAFFVSDLGRARVFYGDLLGYPVEERASTARPGRTASVRIGPDQWIELIEGAGEGEGQLDHVAFSTTDAGAVRAALEARGARALAAPPDGDAFAVADPDGHRIAFVARRQAAGEAMASAGISPRALHAGVLVGDLTQALAFYGGTLGFQEFWRGAGASSKTLSWVNLRVPAGADYLELMLYSDLPPPGNRGSAHHLCLEVPDMDAALATLRPRAARIGYDRPLEIRTGINRKRQLNLFDPDGTRIELMEPSTVDDGRPAPSSTLPPPQPRKSGGER
jgi:catechol 2,3-dioxygenase-like lactoylglutathione lyase family enzyme